MSTIKIIKGLPISLSVGLSSNSASVNLHSGWTTTLELRYQTSTGNTPFELTTSPAGNGYLVEITEEQTSTLNSTGTGYVLIIKASNTDGTVNLRNTVPVSVVNDL